MAEANSANSTPQAAQPGPAQPGPAAPSGESRKLSAIPGQKGPERPAPPSGGAPARSDKPARKGVSRGVFALVVVLLVMSLLGLFVQTQRVAAQDEQIASLEGRVEGLEFQLSAANTQLSTYEVQRSVVRTVVADLMEQMGRLSELVQTDPLAAEVGPETPPPGSP